MKVSIIDYGMGNIFSVSRALEYNGAEVRLTSDPHEIQNSDRLVLPGVGAFKDGMQELKHRGLVDSIREFALKERPFLGICLGMQMMFDYSEEFGCNDGLGIIAGNVKLIPNINETGQKIKIPHIGWNELMLPVGRHSWDNTILENTLQRSFVYFVHSYTAQPVDNSHRLADCYYHGQLISAAVQQNYAFGCQFHPEKSGEIGLNIIKNFFSL
ncbi:imidazole glycerol phosphate synthase subunit HisH [Paenibacillus alginolyticus]|uniref:Imidazole glycerol phosphate synthase subunit HisH n=1 Tax=Paenibacillus alginolyticus TaxID=59839 RepID=A0ABT4G8Q3_9BACL|nr:imidazole glycerol phosphate synthase subunit HisH [Paenibacillus alginolyticus]MCY9692561.1 imidazole glycerol phosphate synthase subunit HisH [Paenibacillus alginolyticus]MEC0143767.1 imidazole glycerol phosphate synthase subunit HisH [Paenibacillus alginolyticus]